MAPTVIISHDPAEGWRAFLDAPGEYPRSYVHRDPGRVWGFLEACRATYAPRLQVRGMKHELEAAAVEAGIVTRRPLVLRGEERPKFRQGSIL